MIELITGLPGNAKTLYTIGEVRKRAEAEGRPVYYSGIKELQLDWTPIDPLNWMDVPPGSIIVIDECQKVFRNRSLGATPPPHVTELEEHRHKGLDFYLITQHPSLIDPAIRRLTQTHKHLIRIFGMEASTVHKWGSCIDTPDKPHMRKDSEKVRWPFDKSLYGVYKSAEAHTMKRSIPMRLKLLLLVPLILIGAIWAVKYLIVDRYAKPVDQEPNSSSKQAAMPVVRAGAQLGREGAEPFDPVKDAEHYVQMSTPRVDGLAYTAPKYDKITEPVRAPVPAACIQVGTPNGNQDVKCKCFSQQGTPLDVPFNMCLGFARNGWFQDFDAEKDREQMARTTEGMRVMEGRASGHVEEGAGVLVFANPPRDYPALKTGSILGSSKGG